MSSILHFGKYKGRSLVQTLLLDPGWFYWAIREDIFQDGLRTEAKDLYFKSRHFNIPRSEPSRFCVLYFVNQSDGKFHHFEIVERQGVYEDPWAPVEKEWIDLLFPFEMSLYDRVGGRIMLRQFKEVYFGLGRTRLKKATCEKLFADDSNFPKCRPILAAPTRVAGRPCAFD